jgi:hypothetical protein
VSNAKLIYTKGQLSLSQKLLARFLGKTIYIVQTERGEVWRGFKDVGKMYKWMGEMTVASTTGSTVNFLVGKR